MALVAALRPMLPDDGPRLAALFAASIEELTGDDYSPQQQAAWMAAADDEAAFAGRLASLLTLVATISGEPMGFASLKGTSHIEMLYVDPAATGQGIATSLIDALERLAAARGATLLSVEASDTAQPFFSKRGYTAKHRSTVDLNGEWLGRTTMEKALRPIEPTRVH